MQINTFSEAILHDLRHAAETAGLCRLRFMQVRLSDPVNCFANNFLLRWHVNIWISHMFCISLSALHE